MKWHPPEEIRFGARMAIPQTLLMLLAVVGAIVAGMETLGAALPLGVVAGVLGIAVWIRSTAAFTLCFHPDGIEHRPSGVRVSYTEIRALYLSHHPLIDEVTVLKSRHFIIAHPGGVWRLPRVDFLDRLGLYQFLLSKSRLLEPPAVFPGRLAEVAAAEAVDFPDLVLSSAGRAAIPGEVRAPITLWFLTGAFLAGTWVAGMQEKYSSRAQALGGFAGFFGVLAFLATIVLVARRASLRQQRVSLGVVVSPRGMTLDSPALKGVLKWSEIKDVRLINQSLSAVQGLLIEIDGGRVLLRDDFICPLTEIHRLILHYLSYEKR